MNRLRATIALLLLGAVAMSGCTRYSSSPVAVYGPYPNATAAFEQAQGAIASRGYSPEQVDPEGGSFEVPMHRSSWFMPTRFRLQVYREGWLTLTPQGGHVQTGGPGVIGMPAGFIEEYVSLTQNLIPPPTASRGGGGARGFLSSPAQPPGALNPRSTAIHHDYVMLIAGPVLFGVGYATSAILGPLTSGDSGYHFVPLAHWAAAFDNPFGAIGGPLVTGGTGTLMEIIGVSLLIAGLLNDTPYLVGSAPVRFAVNGSPDGGGASLAVRF